jgi:predicted N-acetyltransferase YhbS
MQIASIRTDDEWAELVALFRLVFGPDDAHLWQSFHGREPFCRREMCKVAKDEGRIVSHICWVPRLMRIGSVAIRAGAIGYTATHPAFRRRGLAAALMEAWTQELIQRGEHLSFLVGIPKFYEQFGYEFCFPLDMRDPPVFVDPGQLSPQASTLSVRPYQGADLPALSALYDAENAMRTGSLVRTPEYWEWLLHGLAASGRIQHRDIWLVESPAHQPVGYAMLHPGPLDQLEIWEAAAPSGDVAAALLDLAASRARREGMSRVDLKLPLDHRLTQHALARGAYLSGYSYGIYARLLDLPGLFEALRPELERRLRQSRLAGRRSSQADVSPALRSTRRVRDWRGTLRLVTDIGSVDLAIADGKIQTGAEVSPVHTVEVPQSLLVKLVTGYATARWVAGVLNVQWAAGLGSAHIRPELWPILQVLFPKGCPYIWNADIGY